jgi:ribosomal protein L37AE/L43A
VSIFRRRDRKNEAVVRHRPHCSFCGKEQGERGIRLVAGAGVYICNECVSLANQMLRANNGPAPASP